MKTLESSAAERLAEWEAAMLPRALEFFKKFIGNGYYKENFARLIKDLDTASAIHCFYEEFLNPEERKEFYRQIREIRKAAKKNKLADVDNHLMRCGCDEDIADFFYMEYKKHQVDLIELDASKLRDEVRIASMSVLERLNK